MELLLRHDDCVIGECRVVSTLHMLDNAYLKGKSTRRV